jgi:ribose 5-phosphate isomerase B
MHMKIGIASDHGGFDLKQVIAILLKKSGHDVRDFGNLEKDDQDDFPDYVFPLSLAVASGDLDRGIAFCGSGVGAAIAANKVAGVRASLITDHFSAHQGVEDDDMNLLCLGGRISGDSVAKEIVLAFLAARFSGKEKYKRRLDKIRKMENQGGNG